MPEATSKELTFKDKFGDELIFSFEYKENGESQVIIEQEDAGFYAQGAYDPEAVVEMCHQILDAVYAGEPDE